jgi:hypothetical protein
MRFTAYASKIWFLFLLGIIGLFAVGLSLVWHRLPVPALVLFCFLLSVAGIAIVFQLVSTGPVVTADENGLTCYKAFYGTIAWEDIEDSVRAPRVEKFRRGRRTGFQISFTDGWRPIDVYVRNIEKYSKIIPPRFHAVIDQMNSSADHPGCFRFRVDLSGTTGSSERLQAVIEYYLGVRKGTVG